MSGHSTWATTKHKKAAIDAKRSSLFSKLSRNITVAAKVGGDPNPDNNASLAAADRERYVDYLVSLSSREWDGERTAWVKEAERCQRRLDELDAIIRKLYEDSVFGRVSEERYATLSASYEEESKKLKERYMELQSRIASYGRQSKSSGVTG